MIYQDILLLSDLDGTLFNRETRVPERNLIAIRRFIEEGGLFGIATGRASGNALPMLGELPINAPCVFLNGSVLTDHEGKILRSETMPRQAAEPIVHFCLEHFPKVDVYLYTQERVYVVSPKERVDEAWLNEHLPCDFIQVKQVGEEAWCKMLFLGTTEEVHQLREKLMEASLLEGVDSVFSSPRLLEVLPKQVNKGTMVAHIKRLYPDHLLCAVGDYHNDLEMLKAADLSAAPKNAVQEIRQIADVHLCSCDEGAIADLIERLPDIQRRN